MEKLSFVVGIGLALIGFGLEVSGLTNFPTGLGLMIIGSLLIIFPGGAYFLRQWRSRAIGKKEKSIEHQHGELDLSPDNLKKFSSHLDELINGEKLSGLGIIFLNKIKTAPPFLGIDHSDYVISPKFERVFYEHFSSKEFKKANEGIIRCGIPYIGRHGDTPKSVAKKIYGKVKFASKIPYFSFANGSYYRLPPVDTNESRGLSSEEIVNIYSKADEGYVEQATKEMANQYNLPEDELLRLMEIIYSAAQKSKAA